MRRLSNTIYRRSEPFATASVVAVFGALWVAAALVVVLLQARVSAATRGLSVPDVLPLYTPQDLYVLLEQYGPSGREAFLIFTLYDVLYPFVAYGFAVIALVALLRPRLSAHPTWDSLLVLPVVGLIVELLEQAGFLVVLALFPSRVLAVAWATSALSVLKLVLLLALILVLVALFSSWAWSSVRRPKSR